MTYSLARMDMRIAKFKERRHSIRHQVNLPVDLQLNDGSIINVKASNLSLGGLIFNCDDWVSKKIESRGIQHHSLDHTQISITLELGKHRKLYADCRIIIARRVSQDNYLIGLEFIRFHKNTDATLLAYIDSLKA